MIARTPAAPASSTPSGNGKNASEANTAPAGSWSCWRALCTARKEASTRLICPAPIPMAASSRASSTALDLTLPTAAHANRRSRHSSVVGARRVTTFHAASSIARLGRNRSWTRKPPRRRLKSQLGRSESRGSAVSRLVERDHRAERRDAVGRERALVRLRRRAPERDAARRGVLDDGARDAVGPRGDRGDGGVHVEQVVERQLLAVQLPQAAALYATEEPGIRDL